MRGVVSLALAIPVRVAGGGPFPQRNLVVFLAFSVIVVTLVGQGLTLPMVIRRLGVVADDEGTAGDARRALGRLSEVALDHLDAVDPEADGVPAELVDRLRERYRARQAHLDHQREVGRGLREGIEEPLDTEPASATGDEVLVGSTDRLAGPDAFPTQDLAEALDENEPWTPPDVPQLAPTAASPGGDPEAEPPSVEDGRGDDMVGQVPGTAKGPGAVGEPTTKGGALGGTPALETGAIGADTAPSDPARDASGGVQKYPGTDRGPAAPEDRAIRQDIEDD
jgi:hypothetical protein